MSQEILTPERNLQIGGSEAAALLNLYPPSYGFDAMELFMRKSELKDPAIEPNLAMRFGTHNEPFVANEYSIIKGYPHLVTPDIRISEKYPFMIGHIDRLVLRNMPAIGEIWSKDEEQHGVEIKTANDRMKWQWGSEETDAVPDPYNVQVQHYMAICSWLPYFDIPVLIGGSDMRIYRVPRSDKMINLLIEVEGEFIRNLEKGIPPEITGSKASKEYLNIKFRESKDTEIEILPEDETFSIIKEFRDTNEQKKKIEEQYDGIKNLVMKIIGHNRRIKCNGATITLSQASTRQKIDYEAALKVLQQEYDIDPAILETILADNIVETPVSRSLRPNFKGWQE